MPAKADFRWQAGRMNDIRFGVSYQHHDFTGERIRRNYESTPDVEIMNQKGQTSAGIGHEASVYIEDEFRPAEWFSANVGARYVMFNVPGKTYHRIEPRASLGFMTGEGPLCFWKNDMIKEDENGRKSLTFNVGTIMGNYENVSDDLIEYGREYYVVYLYRLSEELYTAYDHFIHQDTDVLGHMDLSPVHYSYTNVKGGFGVLGGISESTVTIPVE